jgi:hypothetical protein
VRGDKNSEKKLKLTTIETLKEKSLQDDRVLVLLFISWILGICQPMSDGLITHVQCRDDGHMQDHRYEASIVGHGVE